MEPKKNFIRMLIGTCAIVAVLGGVVWYIASDISEKSLAIGQVRSEIQNKEYALSALASLQKDAEVGRQYLPQLDRMLTTKEHLFSFSSNMQFLAQQAGFSGAPKFKEETAPQSGELHKTNFSLSLEGGKTLDDLSMFLGLVEQSSYFVRFDSIDVVRDGGLLRVAMSGYVISFGHQ